MGRQKSAQPDAEARHGENTIKKAQQLANFQVDPSGTPISSRPLVAGPICEQKQVSVQKVPGLAMHNVQHLGFQPVAGQSVVA